MKIWGVPCEFFRTECAELRSSRYGNTIIDGESDRQGCHTYPRSICVTYSTSIFLIWQDVRHAVPLIKESFQGFIVVIPSS